MYMEILDMEIILKRLDDQIKEEGYIDDIPSFSIISNYNSRDEQNGCNNNVNSVGLVNDRFVHASSGDKSASLESLLQEILSYLTTMESMRENFAFRQIHSHRKVIGSVIVFFKRFIRKMLKWYIEPVCFQQTDFNMATSYAMSKSLTVFSTLLEEKKKMIDHFDEELASITSQLQTLKKNNEAAALANEKKFSRLNEDIIKNCQDIYPNNLENDFWEKTTYSQSGEDAIIAYILDSLKISTKRCTYLDLGANHAKALSNTYYFYQKGARGVLVEANPYLIPELEQIRTGDIILNKCVSSRNGEVDDFYIISGDGLSTNVKEDAYTAIQMNPSLSIEKIITVETISVREIIDRYFNCSPTLINLDIEGKELDVLQSIDFSKIRPLVFVVETIPYELNLVVNRKRNDIVQFMEDNQYVEYAFTGINSIFVDRLQLVK